MWYKYVNFECSLKLASVPKKNNQGTERRFANNAIVCAPEQTLALWQMLVFLHTYLLASFHPEPYPSSALHCLLP